jgi:hypothetical protein
MKKILLCCCFAACIMAAAAQSNNDTAAIKVLLEKEAATWRSGDVKAHAECWQIRPYSRILVSTTDGKCFDVLPANVVNPPGGKLGNGGFAVLSSFLFSINGSNAWVSHDEVSTAMDGKQTYSHEIRILEKINGQWKLVGQSIHLYTP